MGISSLVSSSSADAQSSPFFLRHPEGVVGESLFGTSSSVDDVPYSFSCLRTPEGVVVEKSPFALSSLVDGAPYSFLPSVAHGGGGSSNDLPAFCDEGGSAGFHLPVTSLASVPYHIDPPPHEIVSSQAPAAPPWEGMSWIQRGGGEAVPVAPVNVFSIGLDLLDMIRVCLLTPRAYAAGLLRLRLQTTQVCRIVSPPSPGSRLKQERCRPRVTGATRR